MPELPCGDLLWRRHIAGEEMMVEEQAQAPKSPGLASAGRVCDSTPSVHAVSHNLSPGSRTNPPLTSIRAVLFRIYRERTFIINS